MRLSANDFYLINGRCHDRAQLTGSQSSYCVFINQYPANPSKNYQGEDLIKNDVIPSFGNEMIGIDGTASMWVRECGSNKELLDY